MPKSMFSGFCADLGLSHADSLTGMRQFIRVKRVFVPELYIFPVTSSQFMYESMALFPGNSKVMKGLARSSLER